MMVKKFVALVCITLSMQGEAMKLTSPAFNYGEEIPKKYTCQGEDISPALAWINVPTKAKTLALIMDDPHAPLGTWVHWIVFNIPATEHGLPEKVLIKKYINAVEGTNSWGKTSYGGPCPPEGTHRYFFTLYALDIELPLTPSATRADIINVIQDHIIDQTTHMGRYTKKKS